MAVIEGVWWEWIVEGEVMMRRGSEVRLVVGWVIEGQVVMERGSALRVGREVSDEGEWK